MKRMILLAAVLLSVTQLSAQKAEIVKTGLNFGPLPAVAFDADKGLQLGGILNIYDFGQGENYPNYNSKWYLEASFFTKGSQLYQLMYDNKVLFPGVRWSSALTVAVDKAMDFYGFNGYQSYYNYHMIEKGNTGESFIFTPYYRMNRTAVLAKTDFIGNLTDNFYWEAGYHASYFDIGTIDRDNINKGKEDAEKFPAFATTLYDEYRETGLISDDEAEGGFTSSIRLGLMYDTRDKEGAPSSGIWAETHLIAAPKFLGTKNPFYRYSATWRQYLPIIKNDKLTFAYRLNYEGTLGNECPFYVLPYITVMGENGDKDGMGGYRTVRGIMRDRVVGLDMASYNAELRWRVMGFNAFNQNIALGLSAFSDGTKVTRGRDMTPNILFTHIYPAYERMDKDSFHVTVGGGFRFIMNENFIVALEYGMPVSRFLDPSNPKYMQDGTGAFYINTGYLF